MRLIPCRKIREGMELARDVVTGPPGTAPLLRTGVLLSERYAKALPQAGIGSVWIEDDLGRDIDVVEPLTPETRERVHRATGDALDAARIALRNGAGLPDSIVASLAEVADALVGDLLEIPEAGVELLRAADLSPLTISVIRDHHERPDGSGYPHGLKGTAIHEFARFAAVADVYDAVTSKRVYSGAVQPHVGVGIVRQGAGTQFCTEVVRHFRAVVMPYPVGHEVVLPDGRRGVVSAVDPHDPDRPTVRVPQGRAIEELKVDMTAPPAALAADPGRRARLVS